jgi:adenosylmethionine-8-amino-7-oxononanoate aminotransferase
MAGDGRGDAVMVTPPFIIGDEEIDIIATTLRSAFDEVLAAEA